MKKLISEAHKKFFSNGRAFIRARLLEKSDFTHTVKVSEKEQTMKLVLGGSIEAIYIDITAQLKEELVKELDAIEYFKCGWFDSILAEKITPSRYLEETSFRYHETMKLGIRTEGGAKFRKKEKIVSAVETAFERQNMTEFINEGTEKIFDRIFEFLNFQIQKRVDEYNEAIEKRIMNILSSRGSLDEVIEINKDTMEGVDTFNKKKGMIDGEIDRLKGIISGLEDDKSALYVKMSKEMFGDDMDALPPNVKEQLADESKLYNKSKRFRF